MKMAPLARVLRGHPRFTLTLVHTGQHYDGMSDPFFRELELPAPDHHLKVGSCSAAEQIALVMTRLIPILKDLKPRLVLVVGDVNSTLAAALAAHKLGIEVGHIEAGLRSFDEAMPEEVNRRLTDAVSKYCFTHSPEADDNLANEGVSRERIFRVGNLMIDSLLRSWKRASQSDILDRIGLKKREYVLLTLHRPSNVDRKEDLQQFAKMLRRLGTQIPVVFPIHPRTFERGCGFGLWRPGNVSQLNGQASAPASGLVLTSPLGYLDFLRLEGFARLVLTDSGGVQEETTALGTPCLTLRENTERPITLRWGTNTLAGTNPERIEREARRLLRGHSIRRRRPPLWDGRSAERLLKVFERVLLHE